MQVSSQKTERLINLTLALLATKRYLSKAEIFKKIPGYEGSAETKERMFERDKDELRSLGIQIEVSSSDPLFEDDLGYLIDSDSLQFGIDEFNKEELLLLTMAGNLWHESALQMDSKSALLKIQSLSGPVESDITTTPKIKLNEDSQLLMSAFSAIENRQTLTFEYSGKLRVVKPFGLITNNGFWYLIASEAEIIKSFKIVRIEGVLLIGSQKDAFVKPTNVDIPGFFNENLQPKSQIATIRIRKGSALTLRNKYISKDIDDDWDEISIPYSYDQEIIELILWYGTDVYLIAPTELKDKLVLSLKELANG
jgi:proteasome accessory factor B